MATASAAAAPHHATPSWTGSIMNLLNPFAAPTDDVHDATASQTNNPAANNNDHHAAPLKRPILSAVVNVDDQRPPSPTRSSGFIMFAEPDTRSTSETGSREGSIDGRRRSKRSVRPKTQFSICHPPPDCTVRQKFHRRPRSLLQFHRLSPSARPRPALEVIPSANFSVRLTRAVARVFKAKHGLCANDLVVLKAEKYNSEETTEEQEAQDVIGLICNKGRKDDEKDKATIHLASGKMWEASPTASGGYEFVTTDEHGLVLTVRWWPKRSKDSSRRSTKRFNFSTISPNSRKHPVIATLSSSSLDIYDYHTIPEPAAKTPLSSPRNDSFPVDAADDDEDEESNGKEQCETDDQLREIIALTSIWVTFREGWSPSFKYDDKDYGSMSSASPSKVSVTPINSPPGSPAQFPLEKRSSIKSIGSGIVRRTSILTSKRNSSQSVPEEQPAQSPSRSSSIRKTSRARADSSSTVLVHRAASNRRKNNSLSQATWRPDLLHTQDTVPEASREDLSAAHSPPTGDKTTTTTTRPTHPSPPPASTAAGATESSPHDSPRPRRPVDRPEHRGSTSTAKTDLSASSGVGPQQQQQREASTRMVRRASAKKRRKTTTTTTTTTSSTTKRSAWRRLLCR